MVLIGVLVYESGYRLLLWVLLCWCMSSAAGVLSSLSLCCVLRASCLVDVLAGCLLLSSYCEHAAGCYVLTFWVVAGGLYCSGVAGDCSHLGTFWCVPIDKNGAKVYVLLLPVVGRAALWGGCATGCCMFADYCVDAVGCVSVLRLVL
jgi:hypothetical protein